MAEVQPNRLVDDIVVDQRARTIKNTINIRRKNIIYNNVYVLPPRIEDWSEVVLRQDLTLRGDFASWHYDKSLADIFVYNNHDAERSCVLWQALFFPEREI